MKATPATAIAAMLLGVAGTPVDAAERGPLSKHGQSLVNRMCKDCHAVGRNGASPHPSAPAFRRLERRLDLGELVVRLRRGPIAGHDDMPFFRLSREDAQAIVSYLRSIQDR